MLTYFIALAAGLAVLVAAADRFVMGSAAIAKNFGISPLIIGLTIVGLGTSAPEILVSAIAAYEGNASLAIGNALGSNIANIGLILGTTALVAPLSMHSGILKRELPVLMAISAICYLLSLIGGLQPVDGIIMLTMLVAFLTWLVRSALRQRNDPYAQEVRLELSMDLTEQGNLSNSRAAFWFLLGLAGLLVSSKVLVWSAVSIAEGFGVSNLIIGLTIVALGTSLPELAANIASVLKQEDELAIGNIVGSNIYNLLAVYSLPALISPQPAPEGVLTRDFPWMLGFTATLIMFGIATRSRSINRWGGLGLLTGYAVYQYFLISSQV